MTQRILGLLIAVGSALSAGVAPSFQPSPTIWRGVYSKEEADRGKQTAAKLCGACHGPELRGMPRAPALTGPRFFDRWHDLRLIDLIAWIQSAMPGDHGFFVPAKETREIVGYVLRESGVPAGAEPISNDVNVLNQILITRKPAS